MKYTIYDALKDHIGTKSLSFAPNRYVEITDIHNAVNEFQILVQAKGLYATGKELKEHLADVLLDKYRSPECISILRDIFKIINNQPKDNGFINVNQLKYTLEGYAIRHQESPEIVSIISDTISMCSHCNVLYDSELDIHTAEVER